MLPLPCLLRLDKLKLRIGAIHLKCKKQSGESQKAFP